MSGRIQNPLVHINIIISVISIHSLANILTGHLFHQEQSFPTQWDFNNNSNHNGTTGVGNLPHGGTRNLVCFHITDLESIHCKSVGYICGFSYINYIYLVHCNIIVYSLSQE